MTICATTGFGHHIYRRGFRTTHDCPSLWITFFRVDAVPSAHAGNSYPKRPESGDSLGFPTQRGEPVSFVECPGDGKSGRGCTDDASGLQCGGCERNFCAFHVKREYHACYPPRGR